MTRVVCGFIRNANPLQTWVMNIRLYVTNALTMKMTSHKMPGICSLLLMIFFCDNTSALPVEKTVDDSDEVPSKDKWKIFNKRGLHMIHLNINSVLSKTDELRVVAKKSKAAVIGVTESKLMQLFWTAK